eukprot:11263651-Ditylum_brightwellii.AAC.1
MEFLLRAKKSSGSRKKPVCTLLIVDEAVMTHNCEGGAWKKEPQVAESLQLALSNRYTVCSKLVDISSTILHCDDDVLWRSEYVLGIFFGEEGKAIFLGNIMNRNKFGREHDENECNTAYAGNTVQTMFFFKLQLLQKGT